MSTAVFWHRWGGPLMKNDSRMEKNLSILGACLLGVVSCCDRQAVVSVVNETEQFRENEIVSVSWTEIEDKLPGSDPENVLVLSSAGDTLPVQIIRNGGEDPVELIFPATVGAGTSADFRIVKGRRPEFPSRVYGRHVPERLDDFAWENDRIGYRMYGPALEATGEISNGIDIWLKRTDEMVVDRWYENGDYHTDHGEGLDCYKVGRTLGAGAMAPYANDTIWLGNNYVSYRVLDRGPLRIAFELTYAPYEADGKIVNERRIVSLDAGDPFNRITEVYDRKLETVAGIVLHGDGEIVQDADFAAYWEPQNGDDGHTAVAVIMPGDFAGFENCGHLLAPASVEANVPFTYYAGAGWSKAGFADASAWFDFVRARSERIARPLRTSLH